MKKSKIFLYHLLVFILGSVGLAVYVFSHLSKGKAGLGGVIVMPAIILVYIVGFGILCLISLAIWLLINRIRSRRKAK